MEERLDTHCKLLLDIYSIYFRGKEEDEGEEEEGTPR